MKRLMPQVGALVALSISVTGTARAQPPQLPEPLQAQDFEQGVATWTGLGMDAGVAPERAPENVHAGGSALRFRYGVAPGQTNVLVSPFAPLSLATLQSISFWIKVDHTTSLAFALQEQGGGRFGTVFSVARDQWQRVEIAPWELVLQSGKDDPKDANGQLDLNRIEGAAFFDFSQVFAQIAADPNSPLIHLLHIETGPRTLFLDDFVLSSNPFPEPPDPSVLDDLKHPQAAWLGVGDVTLKTTAPAPGNANAKSALQVDYTQSPGRISAFAKLLPPGLLTGKTGVSFEISSQQNATLLVQLEEKSGGKYNALFSVFGAAVPTTQTFSFADFKRSQDSKDDNDRLDLDGVKQLLIADISGLEGKGAGENTLRLSPIRLK